MQKQYKVIFIGSGPAVLYGLNYALENKFLNANEILILEKKSYMAGEGLNTDGKMCFNYTRYDFDPTTYFEKIKEMTTVKGKIISFKEFDKSIQNNLIENNIKWEQYDTLHLGTTNGRLQSKILADKIKDAGVDTIVSNEVYDIIDKTDYIEVHSKKGVFYGEKVFIATGRDGYIFNNKISNKFKSVSNISEISIGFRLECDYNDELRNLAECCYDFKFYKDMKKDNVIKVRTFCSCPSEYAQVVKSSKDGYVKFNGHADFNGKKTNKANFAVLASVVTKNINEVLRDVYIFTSNKGMIVDINDLVLKHAPNCIRECVSFSQTLTKILSLTNVKLYIPEIKFLNNSGKQIAPNIYFMGDAALKNTGIVPAAVDGMKTMEEIYGLQG